MVEDTPDDLVFELHARPSGRTTPTATASWARARRSSARVGGAPPVHRAPTAGANLVVAAAGAWSTKRWWSGGAALRKRWEWGQRLLRRAGGGRRRWRREHRIRAARSADPHGAGHAHRSRTVRSASLRADPAVDGAGRRHELAAVPAGARGAGSCLRGLFLPVLLPHRRLLGVYVGTRPEWADRAVDVIREELRAGGPGGAAGRGAGGREGAGEGADGAGAGVEWAAGSTGWRSRSCTRSRTARVDELLARIDAITMDHTAEVAAPWLDPERWLTVRLG
jgi:hypothetical protein